MWKTRTFCRPSPFAPSAMCSLVVEAIAQLGHEGLDGDLVHRCVERDARNDVAEGDDLAELGRLASDPVVQTPLEVNGVPKERRLAVDRGGMPSHHSNRRIFEVPQE